MIGSVSRRQKPYFFLSISSGINSSATWPTADEMTYSSFSKWSPFLGTFPRARARSAATLGFSAMISDLDIRFGVNVLANDCWKPEDSDSIKAGRVKETPAVRKLDLVTQDYGT